MSKQKGITQFYDFSFRLQVKGLRIPDHIRFKDAIRVDDQGRVSFKESVIRAVARTSGIEHELDTEDEYIKAVRMWLILAVWYDMHVASGGERHAAYEIHCMMAPGSMNGFVPPVTSSAMH